MVLKEGHLCDHNYRIVDYDKTKVNQPVDFSLLCHVMKEKKERERKLKESYITQNETPKIEIPTTQQKSPAQNRNRLNNTINTNIGWAGHIPLTASTPFHPDFHTTKFHIRPTPDSVSGPVIGPIPGPIPGPVSDRPPAQSGDVQFDSVSPIKNTTSKSSTQIIDEPKISMRTNKQDTKETTKPTAPQVKITKEKKIRLNSKQENGPQSIDDLQLDLQRERDRIDLILNNVRILRTIRTPLPPIPEEDILPEELQSLDRGTNEKRRGIEIEKDTIRMAEVESKNSKKKKIKKKTKKQKQREAMDRKLDALLGERIDCLETPHLTQTDIDLLESFSQTKHDWSKTLKSPLKYINPREPITGTTYRPALFQEVNQIIDDLARSVNEHQIATTTQPVDLDKFAAEIKVALKGRCRICSGYHQEAASDCPNYKRTKEQAADLITTGISCSHLNDGIPCLGVGHTHRDHLTDDEASTDIGSDSDSDTEIGAEVDEIDTEYTDEIEVCAADLFRIIDEDQSNPIPITHPIEIANLTTEVSEVIDSESGDGRVARIIAQLGNSKPMSIGIDFCAGINVISQEYLAGNSMKLTTGRRTIIKGVGARPREYSNWVTTTLKVGEQISPSLKFLVIDSPGICLVSFTSAIDRLGARPADGKDGHPTSEYLQLTKMGNITVPIRQKTELERYAEIQEVDIEKGAKYVIANEDSEINPKDVHPIPIRFTAKSPIATTDGWLANTPDKAFTVVEGPVSANDPCHHCLLIPRSDNPVAIHEGDILGIIRPVTEEDLDALDVLEVSDDSRINFHSAGMIAHRRNNYNLATQIKDNQDPAEINNILSGFIENYQNIEKNHFDQPETHEINALRAGEQPTYKEITKELHKTQRKKHKMSYKKKAFRASHNLEVLRGMIAKDRKAYAGLFENAENPTYINQQSEEHKRTIRTFFQKAFDKDTEKSPEITTDVIEAALQMVTRHSGRWWIEGCEAPTINNYQVHYELADGAIEHLRQQPFHSSPYDEERIGYYFEKESALKKWRKVTDLHERAQLSGISPAFAIDQDGKGALGRIVVDYRKVNKYTKTIPYPSPNAAVGLDFAQRQKYLTTGDLCWGFTQLELTPGTSRLLAATTQKGIFLPLRLPFGPKNGPASMQTLTDQLVLEATRRKKINLGIKVAETSPQPIPTHTNLRTVTDSNCNSKIQAKFDPIVQQQMAQAKDAMQQSFNKDDPYYNDHEIKYDPKIQKQMSEDKDRMEGYFQRHQNSPFTRETSEVTTASSRSETKSVPKSQPTQESDLTLRDIANIVSFFVDDGTIGGHTPLENIENTDIVLQAMEHYGAQFKLTKTQLLATSISLLGFLIKDGRRYIAPGKRKTAQAWKVRDTAGIVSFLAFANFLREFIPLLSTRAKPLRNFLKRFDEDRRFHEQWAEHPEAQAAFEELKRDIDTGIGLTVPDPTLPYHLFVDASDYAWGASLVQFPVDITKLPRLISCTSGTWTEAQANYDIREKEMLSAVQGLENFSHIIGMGQTYVYTDHRNNCGLFKIKKRSHKRLIRIALELDQFNATICFIKGEFNIVADIPSRLCIDEVTPDILDVRLPHGSVKDMVCAFMKPESWWDNLARGHNEWLICPPSNKEQIQVELASVDEYSAELSSLINDDEKDLTATDIIAICKANGTPIRMTDWYAWAGLQGPSINPDEDWDYEEWYNDWRHQWDPEWNGLSWKEREDDKIPQLAPRFSELAEIQQLPITADDIITICALSGKRVDPRELELKLPKSKKSIPIGLARVEDANGDNFVVTYSGPVKRNDERQRSQAWYSLKKDPLDAIRKAAYHFRRHDKGKKNTKKFETLLEKCDAYEKKFIQQSTKKKPSQKMSKIDSEQDPSTDCSSNSPILHERKRKVTKKRKDKNSNQLDSSSDDTPLTKKEVLKKKTRIITPQKKKNITKSKPKAKKKIARKTVTKKKERTSNSQSDADHIQEAKPTQTFDSLRKLYQAAIGSQQKELDKIQGMKSRAHTAHPISNETHIRSPQMKGRSRSETIRINNTKETQAPELGDSNTNAKVDKGEGLNSLD